LKDCVVPLSPCLISETLPKGPLTNYCDMPVSQDLCHYLIVSKECIRREQLPFSVDASLTTHLNQCRAIRHPHLMGEPVAMDANHHLAASQ